MKHVVLFLLMASSNAAAQNAGVEKIVAALKGAEVFKNCMQFRTDMHHKMTEVKKMSSVDPEAFNNLRLAYTDVYEKYDAFLKSVKLDLSNTENLKKLIQNPDQSASNYASAYEAVKESYETNFLIQYTQITSAGTKGIPIAVLLKFGFDAFKLIAQSIKNNQINKEESLNLVLPLVNEQLFNKLKLPTWSQLQMSEPNGYTKTEAVVIPAKTLNNLNGYVKILCKRVGETQEQPIAISYREGQKDIVLLTETPGTATSKDEYFTTVDSYGLGTKFRVEINNAAFTYVLALNSNGIAVLHPQPRDPQQYTGNRDLTLEDQTPKTGLNFIPAAASDNSPRYFTIVSNANAVDRSAEELAIILSKSELELSEVVEKLNGVTGNLSERITQVFAEQKIDNRKANISFEDNAVHFNADNSSENVLPIVFKILKQ